MSEPAVEVAEVTKEFGGLRAVDRVSLRVAAGERRVLIGPNGAGKTTLFHCITGTLRPTAGRVALFGRDVTRLAEFRRTALGLGRTFQISNVFLDLTVLENLLLAALGTLRRKWVIHRSVDAFADLRQAARRALDLVGLAPRLHESVRRLSYGERRQLELGLALAAAPRVLLLDEPCAGLAPAERQRISTLIRDLPRSITLLMIEHDMDVALGLADRVTVLHRGRVIVEGPPPDVQADAEVREVYFGRV
jgi:branched-chain amino acid transport system ATP-binding protein